jgi:hypothetical protein
MPVITGPPKQMPDPGPPGKPGSVARTPAVVPLAVVVIGGQVGQSKQKSKVLSSCSLADGAKPGGFAVETFVTFAAEFEVLAVVLGPHQVPAPTFVGSHQRETNWLQVISCWHFIHVTLSASS